MASFKIHVYKMESETEQLIDFISTLKTEMIKRLNGYDFSFGNHCKLMLETVKTSRTEELELLTKTKDTPLSKIREISVRHEEYSKKLLEDIDLQKDIQKKLEKNIAVLEENINICEQKIAHLKDKRKQLQKKKDEVLVYKLLTGSHFIYNTRTIKGYVVGRTPNDIQCFDLNPQTYEPEEITQKLYSIIKEVYNASSSSKTLENEESS